MHWQTAGGCAKLARVLTFGDSYFAPMRAERVALSVSMAHREIQKTMREGFERPLATARTHEAAHKDVP